MPRRKRNESDVVKACCQYLQSKKYFFWRDNNIPVFDEKRKRYRAMPLYSMKGVPDIIVITEVSVIVSPPITMPHSVMSEYRGEFIGIECKMPDNKQSLSQKEFEKNCPGRYILAYGVDDLIKAGL